MTITGDDAFARLRVLLVPIRESIEGVVFEPESAPLGSVTGLLSALPSELCEAVGEIWFSVSNRMAEGELRRHFSNEDRLLLDLVLSMSDDRRSFTAPAGADRVP